MRNDSKRKRSILIAAVVLLLSLIAYVYVFDPFIEQVRYDPTGLSDFPDIGYYTIDPETILTSLDHGEIAIFTPETVTPQAPIFNKPFSWHQPDYLRIVDALHQFVWKEPLEGWSLYHMDFRTTCYDGVDGFGLGDFYYFKTIFDNGQIGYTTRDLFISPQYGHVASGGNANFPHPILGWKSIKLDEIQVSAEDVLRIAEENGARQARLSVKNQCNIDVGLSGYTNWEVFMFAYETGSLIFKMEIDPYTGKIK